MISPYFYYLSEWLYPQNTTTNKYSILIVEDDVFLKPVIAKIVYALDPDITLKWAVSVDEANEILGTEKPSLVIADCLLGPGPTGLALWDRCNAEDPKIPFLMISGLGPKSLEKLRTPGEQELPTLIQKPFLFGEFQRHVKEILKT